MKANKILWYTTKNKFLYKLDFRWLITLLLIAIVSIVKLYFSNKNMIDLVTNNLAKMSAIQSKNFINEFSFKIIIILSFIVSFLTTVIVANLNNISEELGVILKIKLLPKYLKQIICVVILTFAFELIIFKLLNLSWTNFQTTKLLILAIVFAFLKLRIQDLQPKMLSRLIITADILIYMSLVLWIGQNQNIYTFIYVSIYLILILVNKFVMNKLNLGMKKILKPFNMYSLYLVNYVRENKVVWFCLVQFVTPFLLEKHIMNSLNSWSQVNFKFAFTQMLVLNINFAVQALCFLIIMKSKVACSDADYNVFKMQKQTIQSWILFVFTTQGFLLTLINFLNNGSLENTILVILATIILNFWLYLKFELRLKSFIFGFCAYMILSLIQLKSENFLSHLKFLNTLNTFVIAIILLLCSLVFVIVVNNRSKICSK